MPPDPCIILKFSDDATIIRCCWLDGSVIATLSWHTAGFVTTVGFLPAFCPRGGGQYVSMWQSRGGSSSIRGSGDFSTAIKPEERFGYHHWGEPEQTAHS